MWGKILKSIRKSLISLQQKCMNSRKSEVDSSVSVHGVQWANCKCCIEESNCDHINAAEGASNVDAQRDANANSSFTHAVINMVGMLIGKRTFACFFFFLD